MGKQPSRVVTAFAIAWRRTADVSTAFWLWSFLPSGILSVFAAWRASVAGLPDWAVLLVALGVLALFVVVLAGLRVWRVAAPLSNAGDRHYHEKLARLQAREQAKKTMLFQRLFGGNLGDILEEIEKDRIASAEARRQRMIQEASEIRRPRSDAWMPLHAALQYLVYDSDWGHQRARPASRDDFDRLVSLEIRERLARGELRARGAKGGAFSDPDRPTEEIPHNYWLHGFIQPHGEIVMADPNRAAAGNPMGSDTYRRVIISSEDLMSIWPRSSVKQMSSLALFVEPARKEFERSSAA